MCDDLIEQHVEYQENTVYIADLLLEKYKSESVKRKDT